MIDFVFQDTDTMYVCLAFDGTGGYLAHLSIFRALKDCQINIPKKHFPWQKKDREYDELDKVIAPNN